MGLPILPIDGGILGGHIVPGVDVIDTRRRFGSESACKGREEQEEKARMLGSELHGGN